MKHFSTHWTQDLWYIQIASQTAFRVPDKGPSKILHAMVSLTGKVTG